MPHKSHAKYISYTPELVAELKALVKPLTRPEGVKALGKKLGLSERQARRAYAKYLEGAQKLSDADIEVSLARINRNLGVSADGLISLGKGLKQIAAGRPIRRLYYDIESAPNVGLFWKSGYKLTISPENILKERAVICISWKWFGEKKTHVLHWDENQCDKKMLEAFGKVVAEADEMVGHNLSRFDMPWIRTRCLFHGLPPIAERKEIDTLKWARSKFYFNSNKLDYIATFLGLGGKIKTEFGLWKEVVLNRCPKAMKAMCEYCQYDVILLEKVWERLSEIMPVKTHVGVLNGGPAWACPRTGSTDVKVAKTRVSAAGVTQYQMVNKRTGSFYTISGRAHEEYLAAKGY